MKIRNLKIKLIQNINNYNNELNNNTIVFCRAAYCWFFFVIDAFCDLLSKWDISVALYLKRVCIRLTWHLYIHDMTYEVGFMHVYENCH